MPTVIFDACVLYPAPLRDLLMHLALTGLFKAKWTNEIHEEWIRNLLKQRSDLTRPQFGAKLYFGRGTGIINHSQCRYL